MHTTILPIQHAHTYARVYACTHAHTHTHTHLDWGHVDFFRGLNVVPDTEVAPVLRHHHIAAWHPLDVGAVVQHARLLPALNVKQVQLHTHTHTHKFMVRQYLLNKLQIIPKHKPTTTGINCSHIHTHLQSFMVRHVHGKDVLNTLQIIPKHKLTTTGLERACPQTPTPMQRRWWRW